MANIKSQIAEILNIENSAAWDVVDFDEEKSLYLVHHRPEADLNLYGDIRGIIVDIKAKTIVCKSYPYTPVYTSDKLRLSKKGRLTIKEFDKSIVQEGCDDVILDMDNVDIKIGFEGTLIHVFKHDGRVYRSTRKKIDASRSRWGKSDTFTELYWKLNGPKDEDLFNPDSKYSPYCYIFIVVHPSLQVASKDNVGDGYLVYLGVKKLWDTNYDLCPYKQTKQNGDLFDNVSQESFDNDKRPNAGWISENIAEIKTVCISDKGVEPPKENTIYTPCSFNMVEANKYLNHGFYDNFKIPGYDHRLYPGEFLIIHVHDKEGNIKGLIRVESPSYRWRCDLINNDPNLLHRFYQLLNDSYINNKRVNPLAGDVHKFMQQYRKKYPIFGNITYESISNYIQKHGAIIHWPVTNNKAPTEHGNKNQLLHNIWLSLMSAVPITKQSEVLNFLKQLNDERYKLIGWIWKLLIPKNYEKYTLSKRIQNILQAARKPKPGLYRLSNKQIKDNIRNFIMKEEGTSLYRLIREMKKWTQRLKRDQQKDTSSNAN